MGAKTLQRTIASLPARRVKAYQQSKKARMSGVTSEILKGEHHLITFLLKTLSELAAHYPKGHFGREPANYFQSLSAALSEWHSRILEPDGRLAGGTMVRVLEAAALVNDLERMVSLLKECSLGFHSNTRDWWTNK